MSEGEKKALYIVDEGGQITPEVRRIQEVTGITTRLLGHSATIGDALVGIRFISHDLAVEKKSRTPFAEVFEFPAESEAKEELAQIAQFLERLNMRIWSVSRTLGTQVNELASRIETKDDEKFSQELEKFLKTDPINP